MKGVGDFLSGRLPDGLSCLQPTVQYSIVNCRLADQNLKKQELF
jgi:hypothetical protein